MGYAFIHDWTTEGDPRPMAGFGAVKGLRPGAVQREASARQAPVAIRRVRRGTPPGQQGEIGQPESGEWDAHGGGGSAAPFASQSQGGRAPTEDKGGQLQQSQGAPAPVFSKGSEMVLSPGLPRPVFDKQRPLPAPPEPVVGPEAKPAYGDNPRLIGTYQGRDPAGPSGSGFDRRRVPRFQPTRLVPDSTGQGGGLVPGPSYPGDTTGQGGGVTYGPPTTQTGGGIVQNTDPSALIGGGAGPTPGGPSSGGGFAVPGPSLPGKHFSPDSFGPRAFERPYMGRGRPPAWPGPWDREGGTTVTVVQAQQQAAVQDILADHAQAAEGGMPAPLLDFATRDNLVRRAGLTPAEADQLVAQAAAAEDKAISPWLLAGLAAVGVGVVYHLSKKKKSGQR